MLAEPLRSPAPLSVGDGGLWTSVRDLLRWNEAFIRLSKGLFSYQIFVRAIAKPTVHNLLGETIESSDRLRESILKIAC